CGAAWADAMSVKASPTVTNLIILASDCTMPGRLPFILRPWGYSIKRATQELRRLLEDKAKTPLTQTHGAAHFSCHARHHLARTVSPRSAHQERRARLFYPDAPQKLKAIAAAERRALNGEAAPPRPIA